MNHSYYLTYYEVLKDVKSSLDGKVRFYLYNPSTQSFDIETFSVKYVLPSYYFRNPDKIIKSVNNLKKDYEKYLYFLEETFKDNYYVQKRATIDDDIRLIPLKESKYYKFLLWIPNLPRPMIEKNLKGVFQLHNSFHDFIKYHLEYPFSKIVIKENEILNYKYFYLDKFTTEDYKILENSRAISLDASFDESLKISIYDGKDHFEFKTKSKDDLTFLKEVAEFFKKYDPLFVYTYNFHSFYGLLDLNAARILKLGIKEREIKTRAVSGELKEYIFPGRVCIDLWFMENLMNFDLSSRMDSLKDKAIALYQEGESLKHDLLLLSKLYNLLPNDLAFHGTKRRVSDFFMKLGYLKKQYPKVKPYNDYILKPKEPLLFREFEPYDYLYTFKEKPIIFKEGLFVGDVVDFYPLQNTFKEIIPLDDFYLKNSKNKDVVLKEFENISSYVLFLFLFQPERAKKELNLLFKERINQKDYVKYYLNVLKEKINSLEGIINFYKEELVFENFSSFQKKSQEDFLLRYSGLILSFDQSKYVLSDGKQLYFRGFNLRNKTEYEKELIIQFLDELMIKKNFYQAFEILADKIKNIYNENEIHKFYYRKRLDQERLKEYLDENSYNLKDYKIKRLDERVELQYLLKKEEFLKEFQSSTNVVQKMLKSIGLENQFQLYDRKTIRKIVKSLYDRLKKSENLRLF